MTPLQLAQEECANHQRGGSCLGIQIDKNLRMTYAKPRPGCLVADDQRCGYFEACLLPRADSTSDPHRARALRQAATEYRRITEQPMANARPCPDCGEPLQPRKQFCPVCAEKRRKAAIRQAVAKCRSACNTSSQKTHPIP